MTDRFLLILIFLFSFFSCNTNDKKNENEDFYVIKHKDYSKVDTDEISIMVEYYFDYNIILLDSISDIYYHKKRWGCRTGREFNGNLPYFGFLQPKDFIKTEDLDNLKGRVLADMLSDSTETSHRVGLICNKDTIRDKRYFELKKFFLSNDIGVSVRKTTEEENAILESIMERKEYEPYLIEWKNTFGAPDSSFYE
ncbi:hypothetical protein LJC68_03475 [Bacteroidales bacterium OttesenSCG-928-B11]|nr:hypothetical protein [Bacteroidales bacterium OttesenSCG-928-B11]